MVHTICAPLAHFLDSFLRTFCVLYPRISVPFHATVYIVGPHSCPHRSYSFCAPVPCFYRPFPHSLRTFTHFCGYLFASFSSFDAPFTYLLHNFYSPFTHCLQHILRCIIQYNRLQILLRTFRHLPNLFAHMVVSFVYFLYTIFVICSFCISLFCSKKKPHPECVFFKIRIKIISLN